MGPEVTELLPELSLAQYMEITPAEIARNVHSHPTLSEVIMEAAHVVEGHADSYLEPIRITVAESNDTTYKEQCRRVIRIA